MPRFEATPASEGLASFLQGLAPGAHAAVDLGGLDVAVAVAISRQVAHARGERFLVVAHRPSQGDGLVAGSLPDALPIKAVAAPDDRAWVVVDAAGSVASRSPEAHAQAEAHLGREVAQRLTVVCFYTPEAVAQVQPARVHRLHGVVAVPGQV